MRNIEDTVEVDTRKWSFWRVKSWLSKQNVDVNEVDLLVLCPQMGNGKVFFTYSLSFTMEYEFFFPPFVYILKS